MNKVTIKGRTTKAPEIRYAQKDNESMCFARFSMAIEDRSYKQSDGRFHVDYIPCTAMGKLAELIERSVGKGQELVLAGKWRTSSFEKDGKNIYTNEMLVQELYFCGKKADNHASSVPEDFMNIPQEMIDEMPFK